MYEVTLARRADFKRIVKISAGCYKPSLSLNDVSLHYDRIGKIYVVRGGISRQAYAYAMIRYGLGEFQVLDIGVSPDVRRKGIGRMLIEQLQFIAAYDGYRRVLAYVGDDNLPGQVFLRRCGYWCVSILDECYEFELDMKKPRSAALMPVNRISKALA